MGDTALGLGRRHIVLILDLQLTVSPEVAALITEDAPYHHSVFITKTLNIEVACASTLAAIQLANVSLGFTYLEELMNTTRCDKI